MDTPMTTPPRVRTASTDRRSGNRHRLDVPATLALHADGGPNAGATPVAAVVTAFSVNGVGLRVAQALAVGDVYTLSTFDSLIPPGLRVRVRSQRHTPAGDHEIGAEVVQN